jgi:hypothetical protein
MKLPIKVNIFIDEPWNFKDIVGKRIFSGVLIKKFEKSNCYLIKLTRIFRYEGNSIKYLTISPRYVGTSISQLPKKEVIVGIDYVNDIKIIEDLIFDYKKVKYFAIGSVNLKVN